MKYKAVIAYDGSSYGGWQEQPNAVSIQELIEQALLTALREPVNLVGSGRTDAGVHALGQVAHFVSEKNVNLSKLLFSLNGLLPKEIRILSLDPVPDTFHARFSAQGKIYHYHLQLGPIASPFDSAYRYHIPYPVNVALMREAAQSFIGTHDFTSFSHQAHKGSAAFDPIRTLYRLDLIEEEGGIRIECEGNGFLYKMVRNIVGTLIEIGGGKILISEIPAIFAAKNRARAGTTAPPHGLFLVKVLYE